MRVIAWAETANSVRMEHSGNISIFVAEVPSIANINITRLP